MEATSSSSKENKTWQEDIYGNHVPCIRFSSHLTGDFQDELYDRESCFGEMLFDGSLCEMEAFVKRCGYTNTTDDESKGQIKRKASESLANGPAQNFAASSEVVRLFYLSNRRPVTEAEKASALNLARAATTPKNLVVVMRPENVYGDYMSVQLSKNWCAKHLLPSSQFVSLQVKEKMWRVIIDFHGYYWSISQCWKDLAVSNCLDEFDVCEFNRAGRHENGTLTLDVTFFRVVQEAIPLSCVSHECGYMGSKSCKREAL